MSIARVMGYKNQKNIINLFLYNNNNQTVKISKLPFKITQECG